MHNLNIDDGSITLCVNQDQSRLLVFNPNDVNFAKRFYDLIKDFEEKEGEFVKKARKVDAEMEYDAEGNPLHIDSIFNLMGELDTYFKEKLDYIFGEGSSKTIFNGVNCMSRDAKGNSILANFIMGITPYIEGARRKEVTKHTAKYEQKKRKPRVD